MQLSAAEHAIAALAADGRGPIGTGAPAHLLIMSKAVGHASVSYLTAHDQRREGADLPHDTYSPSVTLPDDEREILERPVQPYVGLTLAEAESLATSEGRRIRVLSSLSGPRHLDLMPSRVNVELDKAGRVVGADAG